MTSDGQLVVPALRAKMGDNVYYVTFLRMSDIVRRISFAQEIHRNRRLRDLIQRQVTNRSREIGEYLRTQPQRFFNALIVGVYGGSPRWYELSIGKNRYLDPDELPEYMSGALGILILDGTEQLFAIDGQHRVAGIRHALEASGSVANLANEEICVLFLAANVTEPDGLERTRRLFTTLNRYAKPVSMMDIIALDEDDAIAIITRGLVEDHPLFKEHRVSRVQGKAIPVTDNESFTTLVTLYEVHDIILANKKGRAWTNFKRFRPSDDVLSDFDAKARDFWGLMIEHFPLLAQIRDGTDGEGVAGRYRHRDGGHLLFRPVGLLSVARAAKLAAGREGTFSTSISKLSQTPMDLAAAPWLSLLWDGVAKKMITIKENQKTAAFLLLYMVGVDLTPFRITEQRLKTLYAGALNRPVDEVSLPQKIR